MWSRWNGHLEETEGESERRERTEGLTGSAAHCSHTLSRTGLIFPSLDTPRSENRRRHLWGQE